MKKTLIINGHPDKEGLCTALEEKHKVGVVKNSSKDKRT